MKKPNKSPLKNEHPVECPACGEDMRFTGETERSDVTGTIGFVAECPRCGNVTLVSQSSGDRDR